MGKLKKAKRKAQPAGVMEKQFKKLAKVAPPPTMVIKQDKPVRPVETLPLNPPMIWPPRPMPEALRPFVHPDVRDCKVPPVVTAGAKLVMNKGDKAVECRGVVRSINRAAQSVRVEWRGFGGKVWTVAYSFFKWRRLRMDQFC
jgi:hypothetical protein